MSFTYKVTYYNPDFAGIRSMNVDAEYHSEAENLVRGMVPGADVVRVEQVSGGGSSSSGGDVIGLLLLGGVLFVLYYVWNAIAQFAQFIWQIILSVIDWFSDLISWFPFQLAVGSIFIFFFVILIASIDD